MVPITMVKSWTNEVGNEETNIDKLVTVCSALINVLSGIVYTE